MESDDLFWVKGNHTLEAGAEFSRWQSNMYNDFFMSGSYTFPTLQGFLQATNTPPILSRLRARPV